ncbi:MAG: class I SAM-dependent methyltransferase [Candidatus Uhrbacteria bacterium]
MFPRRFDIGSTLMREATRWIVDKALIKRAEWMVEASGLVEELRPLREKKKAEQGEGLSVLCLGAGKGHEMDEIDTRLPETTVVGVDPHDHWAPPVKKRLERLGHKASYLHESFHAGDLKEIGGASQDVITLFFVLHHVEGKDLDKIFSEIDRVLIKGEAGRIFVAEDIVDNDEERRITTDADRRINLEIRNGPHDYKSTEEWREFFLARGFAVKRVNEIKPDKVKHGFFILERVKETKPE